MQLNPYESPYESEAQARPRTSIGWILFGGVSGLIGLGVLVAEAACLMRIAIDSEFRGLVFSAKDALSGLIAYAVIGLLFVASAYFAFRGRRRLAFACFSLPIALFSIMLQLSGK